MYDAYLCKYTSTGVFQWVRTWGGSDTGDWAWSVSCDSQENIYVTGGFNETVDFGDGNPITATRYDDAYLCKFNSSGAFLCVRTWGDDERDTSWSVSNDDQGNIYLAGTFEGSVDFGDGYPVDATGLTDANLLKFHEE
jgi:hypothetical protein